MNARKAKLLRRSKRQTKALSFLMYELNEAYSSKYGYYIYEDEELQPLHEWLRAADPQAIYHIGNVLDYTLR